MPNVYVEARPKGRPENSPIEDYVVEDHADHVLAGSRTKARPSPGRTRKAISRSSPGSATSATRRIQITGEPPSGRAIITPAD
jgi:hypothetical protein